MSKEIKVSGTTRNLDHIAQMMRDLDSTNQVVRLGAALEIAIWAKDVLSFEEEDKWGGTFYGRVRDYKAGLCASLGDEIEKEMARTASPTWRFSASRWAPSLFNNQKEATHTAT